jgi:hypothetical protein
LDFSFLVLFLYFPHESLESTHAKVGFGGAGVGR